MVKRKSQKIGLVLSGGGARASYQAGAIQALYEIGHELGIDQPFQIYSGTSAGSINAVNLAAYADKPQQAVKRMIDLWSNVTSSQIYKSDAVSILSSAIQLLGQTFLSALNANKKIRSVFDTDPLKELLIREIPFKRIQKNIENKVMDSLTVTAMNYSAGNSCSFFQCIRSEPWQRHQRIGVPAQITIDHIMASTAIPILFPPARIGDQYFGDGNLRNYTPLSSAIRLNASKLVVVGTRRKLVHQPTHGIAAPSPARVIGILLNSLLLDTIDLDYERLSRINTTLTQLKSDAKTKLSPIDVLMIRPSQDLGKIAFVESMHLPKLIRF